MERKRATAQRACVADADRRIGMDDGGRKRALQAKGGGV